MSKLLHRALTATVRQKVRSLALLLILCSTMVVPLYLFGQPNVPVSGGSTTGTLGGGRILVGYGAAGSSVLAVQRTVLTNDQIKLLLSTPITVVSAQGTGTIIQQLGGLLVFDYTAAYTETGGNDNWQLYYGGSNNEVASNVMETTGFVDATADAALAFGPLPTDTLFLGAQLSNTAIVLSGVTGGTYHDLGGGNAANTITVHVLYRTITTGL